MWDGCRRNTLVAAEVDRPASGCSRRPFKLPQQPVLIIQNDVGNRYSPTPIVVAITSQPRRRAYPFQVAFTAEEGSLRLDGTLLCEQIQTVDQTRLEALAGGLPESKMAEVDEALHRSLGLKT